QQLRFPGRPAQFRFQERRGVFLHEDDAFEIETGGQAEVLVARAGVTVAAAVLAAAVRVERRVERDVGTRVPADDAAARVGDEAGAGLSGFTVSGRVRIGFESVRCEARGGVGSGAAFPGHAPPYLTC